MRLQRQEDAFASISTSSDRRTRGKMIRTHLANILKYCILLLTIVSPAICHDPLRADNTSLLSMAPTWWSWIEADSQRVIRNLPKNKSTRSLHFTDWSEWSVCNRHCSQNRVKRCRVESKCGNSVMREERSCYHKRKGRRRRCKQREKRGDQRKNERLHVLQIPKEAKPRHGKRRGKGFRDQASGHYGKWSKWSSCTRSCTTQRHRWCRKPGICGRDVIRETAYCYIEGTFCQKWINRKIRGSHEDETNELILDEYELNPNTIDNFGAAKDVGNWKCGVTNTGKNSKLSYYTRIIGGRPTSPGSWPWQVVILNRHGEAFCGGTLLSPRWVLTAAHCIRKRLYVRIGEHDLTVKEGPELDLRVYSITVHPHYDADTVDNDVALLRLPVSLTPAASRGIACLPTPRQALPTNQLCTIIGWGKSRATDDFGTDVLHEARIPIVSAQTCRDVYVDYRITKNMFCAGYPRGRMDSCAGDSGGPLLCRDPKRPDRPWTIFGITSFGEGCGKRGKFGIYARIPNYVRWIQRVMKQYESEDGF